MSSFTVLFNLLLFFNLLICYTTEPIKFFICSSVTKVKLLVINDLSMYSNRGHFTNLEFTQLSICNCCIKTATELPVQCNCKISQFQIMPKSTGIMVSW